MIEFRALGPAELAGPEGSDPGAVLARPKLFGLMSYLSAGPARGFHRRDSLIGLFWSELDQDRARSAVRQSLYRIRRFLGERVVVTRGDDEVSLSQDEFWCDVEAFEEALDRGDRETALGFYRGDLLQGLYVPDAPEFERWLDERRKQLRERAAAAAWELANHQAARHDTVAAGHWSRHARNLNPLDERLLRRVIQLLDQLGDRSGAVREYEAFARRLADELELEPSPETVALIESVRSRNDVAVREAVPSSGSDPAEATVSSPSPVPLPHKERDRGRRDGNRVPGLGSPP
jgi:DNA-binding SARP family transcriptional activator